MGSFSLAEKPLAYKDSASRISLFSLCFPTEGEENTVWGVLYVVISLYGAEVLTSKVALLPQWTCEAPGRTGPVSDGPAGQSAGQGVTTTTRVGCGGLTTCTF